MYVRKQYPMQGKIYEYYIPERMIVLKNASHEEIIIDRSEAGVDNYFRRVNIVTTSRFYYLQRNGVFFLLNRNYIYCHPETSETT